MALALVAATSFAANAIPENDIAPTTGTPHYGDTYFGYLGQCPLDFDNHCVGVGWDGTYLWVSAGDGTTGHCSFYILDWECNQIASVVQGGGATGWGNRDLAYAYGYMWGSFSYAVNAFNPGTYDYAGNFMGCINPNRCMAYGCDDAFYTCGFGEYIYRMTWDGSWGSSAFCDVIGGPVSGAYGMAYDYQEDCLWMTTADYSGDVYKYSCSGALIETFTVTALGPWDIQGGCTMACHPEWNHILVVLMQSAPDTIVFIDLEHNPTPVEDSSWGAIKAMYH
jgi:hypothetical protein